MCGRFTLKTPPDQWSQLLLPIIDSVSVLDNWQPRYNIAPTQNILAVTDDESGQIRLDYYRWGLVPSWSADLSIGSRMINARRETLREKKSFVGPLKKRRCLVVADGYYEWQKLDSRHKQPYWISPASGGVIHLAGLWESNSKASEQPLQTCTIITTAANGLVSSIHDRMPVVLMDRSAQRWLDPLCGVEEAFQLLGPPAEDFFKTRKVSTRINNVRNDDAAAFNEIRGLEPE